MKKVIIEIGLNTKTFTDERLKKEWISKRISVFMNYTFRSLKAQTNQDFDTLVHYTYNTAAIVQEELEKYRPLPDNVRFVTPKEYYQQIRDLIKDHNYLYLARIDSDDMYHKSFIQQLHGHMPDDKTEVLINQKGYIYDSVNGRLANYFYESPPFYTLIYSTPDYLKGKKYKLAGGHPGAIELSHEILNEGNFMIVVHTGNTSMHFNTKQREDEITDKNKIKEILAQFIG